MPHLEEQFPPVNPLVLQRPDALDPPEREEEEETRPAEARAEDETPLPGTLANGIDRVTLSANARAIAPIQPLEETVPLPANLIPGKNEVNPAVPELLDIETQRREIGAEAPAADEIIGTSLQDFLSVLETRRREEESSTRTGLNPIEPRPTATPVTAPEPPPTNEIEPQVAEEAAPRDENQFAPVALAPRGPLSVEPEATIAPEPAEAEPLETQGLRGNIPVPRDEGRVNIIPPPTGGEDPPGPNIQEARNFGEGRALTLDLTTAGNEDTFIAVDTVDEALEEGGALPTSERDQAPFELLNSPATQLGFLPEPELIEETESAPNLEETPETAPAEPRVTQRDPANDPGPAAPEVVASSLTDTRQVFEEDQETQSLQRPAFPELDPGEPFIPNVQPEAQEEDVPAVVQAPVSDPLPAVEDAVPPVAPPVPGNVEALNENPAALRRSNLGTDPALRSNRELRNFLQEFNDRIEPPEEVTEPAGGPITEVQNNAPPPPAVFENLEAVGEELLNDLREQEAREGVIRPEEQRIAPPEPRTPESILTERGQNIDRFI